MVRPRLIIQNAVHPVTHAGLFVTLRTCYNLGCALMQTKVDGVKVKAVRTTALPRVQALHIIAKPGFLGAASGQVGKDFWRMMLAGIWIGLVKVGHASGLTTPSSATPGREPGCEHSGARR